MKTRRESSGAPKAEIPRREDASAAITSVSRLARTHLRFGWWGLLGWLSLGVALESLHGFKVSWYMAVQNETRRFLLTLAHAHGTLLSLIHIAFALTLNLSPPGESRSTKLASISLIAASLLVPAGFFLGGVFAWSGDPGLAVLLVPIGAPLLLFAVLFAARRARAL